MHITVSDHKIWSTYQSTFLGCLATRFVIFYQRSSLLVILVASFNCASANCLARWQQLFKYQNNTGVSAYVGLYGSICIIHLIFLCRIHIYLPGVCYVDGGTIAKYIFGQSNCFDVSCNIYVCTIIQSHGGDGLHPFTCKSENNAKYALRFW